MGGALLNPVCELAGNMLHAQTVAVSLAVFPSTSHMSAPSMMSTALALAVDFSSNMRATSMCCVLVLSVLVVPHEALQGRGRVVTAVAILLEGEANLVVHHVYDVKKGDRKACNEHV